MLMKLRRPLKISGSSSSKTYFEICSRQHGTCVDFSSKSAENTLNSTQNTDNRQEGVFPELVVLVQVICICLYSGKVVTTLAGGLTDGHGQQAACCLDGIGQMIYR